MAQLYLTRAKTFIGNHNGAERVLSVPPSGGRPVMVPDWVRTTQTFKHGIKDKSIVDLTPPAQPKPKEVKPAAEVPDGDGPPVETVEADNGVVDDADEVTDEAADKANADEKGRSKANKKAGNKVGLGA
jgi:hypothetical protein